MDAARDRRLAAARAQQEQLELNLHRTASQLAQQDPFLQSYAASKLSEADVQATASAAGNAAADSVPTRSTSTASSSASAAPARARKPRAGPKPTVSGASTGLQSELGADHPDEDELEADAAAEAAEAELIEAEAEMAAAAAELQAAEELETLAMALHAAELSAPAPMAMGTVGTDAAAAEVPLETPLETLEAVAEEVVAAAPVTTGPASSPARERSKLRTKGIASGALSKISKLESDLAAMREMTDKLSAQPAAPAVPVLETAVPALEPDEAPELLQPEDAAPDAAVATEVEAEAEEAEAEIAVAEAAAAVATDYHAAQQTAGPESEPEPAALVEELTPVPDEEEAAADEAEATEAPAVVAEAAEAVEAVEAVEAEAAAVPVEEPPEEPPEVDFMAALQAEFLSADALLTGSGIPGTPSSSELSAAKAPVPVDMPTVSTPAGGDPFAELEAMFGA